MRLLLCLFLTSCQTVKDRYDLWFVVPKNPFNPLEHACPRKP